MYPLCLGTDGYLCGGCEWIEVVETVFHSRPGKGVTPRGTGGSRAFSLRQEDSLEEMGTG